MRVEIRLFYDDGTLIHSTVGNGRGPISANYITEGGIVLEGEHLRLLGWDWTPSMKLLEEEK